jgi:hypothetical protein
VGLQATLKRVLRPENGGPRKRTVLEGLAKHYGYKADFDEVLKRMIDAGEIVMVGEKRGARYALPGAKR